MAQSMQQRQKALEKQAKKRKEKHAAIRRQQQHEAVTRPGGSRHQIQAAAAWPVSEVLLSQGWNAIPGALAQIAVAREAPDGRVAVGSFLVDLGCLGVKNAMAVIFGDFDEYDRALRRTMMSTEPLMQADLNLVAKIVRDAIAYAADLGFMPHTDYQMAAPILAGADPDACPVEIPLGGPDNMPVYVAGPNDNVQVILTRLERRLGPDGFEVVLPLPVLPRELFGP
jgi:hypothetical protein